MSERFHPTPLLVTPPQALWRLVLCAVSALLLSGCLGHQKGSVVPGTTVSNVTGADAITGGPVFEVYGNYYVERLPSDERGINRLLVDQLRARGLKAATGESGMLPGGTDVVVSYQDRWMWDMTMYMIRLNIQFKSVDGELLASGESFRTTMVRKPPEMMISEIYNAIFEELDPALVIAAPEEPDEVIKRSRHGNNQSSEKYRF